MTRANSLQAVLSREAASPEMATKVLQPAATAQPEKFYRPSRDGRRFLGGHFDPKVVRQMKLIAVEEDTTTQALLEEAVDLLFVKKGRSRMHSA